MKIRCRFTRLNIPIPDEEPLKPYIVSFKYVFFGRWKYIIDEQTKCPKLYFGGKLEVQGESLEDLKKILFAKSVKTIKDKKKKQQCI